MTARIKVSRIDSFDPISPGEKPSSRPRPSIGYDAKDLLKMFKQNN